MARGAGQRGESYGRRRGGRSLGTRCHFNVTLGRTLVDASSKTRLRGGRDGGSESETLITELQPSLQDENDGSVDEYFSKEELAKMSAYEKNRYENLKRNYMQMIRLGIQPQKPQFMQKQQRKRASRPAASDDSGDEWRPSYDDRFTSRRGRRRAARRVCYADSSSEDFSDSETSDVSSDEEKQNRKRKIGIKKTVHKHLLLPRKEAIEKITADIDIGSAVKVIVPCRRRSSMRLRCSKSYQQFMLDDDTYIFCQTCKKEFVDGCTKHPLLLVSDTKASLGKDRAKRTIPFGLSVSASKIKGAGLGIWSDVPLKVNTLFGPYEGAIIPFSDVDPDYASGYSWLVYKEGQPHHYVDGVDTSHSNWLRYVNCGRSEDELNMEAFQYRGDIYYYTTKDVRRGQELLVWYGDEYAKELGIKDLDYLEAVGSARRVELEAPSADNVSAVGASNDGSRVVSGPGAAPNGVDVSRHAKGRRIVRNTEVRPCRKMLTSFELQYTCANCDLKFDSFNELQRHERTHTDERPYVCKQCGKSFKRSNHLAIHQRTHTGERRFGCNQCGQRFTQSGNLANHERTHTGERPFGCNQCGKRFTQSGSLANHERTHTGERPFGCNQCGKRFTTSGSLANHERTHTGERPFGCNQCGRRFTTSGSLARHELTHAGERRSLAINAASGLHSRET